MKIVHFRANQNGNIKISISWLFQTSKTQQMNKTIIRKENKYKYQFFFCGQGFFSMLESPST